MRRIATSGQVSLGNYLSAGTLVAILAAWGSTAWYLSGRDTQLSQVIKQGDDHEARIRTLERPGRDDNRAAATQGDRLAGR